MRIRDQSQLRSISRTSEGFLVCRDVVLARSGPYEYDASEIPVIAATGVTGVVTVNRSADTYTDEIINKINGLPVTLGHPSGADNVTPENFADLIVGTSFNSRRVNGLPVADLIIYDPRAIDAIDSGVREVSIGFDGAYFVDKSGTYWQELTDINHTAVLPDGRCGAQCSIRDKEKPMKPSNKFIDKLRSLMRDEGMEMEEKSEEMDKKDMKPEDAPPDPMSALNERLTRIESMLVTLAKMEETEAMIEDKMKDMDDPEKENMEGMDRSPMDKSGKMHDKSGACTCQDTIARAEILVPGIRKTSSVVRDSLNAFARTPDGARTILELTGGVGITDANRDAVFIAAAEAVKSGRSLDMGTGKTVDGVMVMTAEKLQEQLDKFWGRRQ